MRRIGFIQRFRRHIISTKARQNYFCGLFKKSPERAKTYSLYFFGDRYEVFLKVQSRQSFKSFIYDFVKSTYKYIYKVLSNFGGSGLLETLRICPQNFGGSAAFWALFFKKCLLREE